MSLILSFIHIQISQAPSLCFFSALILDLQLRHYTLCFLVDIGGLRLADTTPYSMDAMESPDYPPPLVDASRPSLGFPLGTALLLLVIFSLSGIFSCCYHWDKLRSFRRSTPNDDLESKPPNNINNNKSWTQESMPVLMPGDDVPRFIALPCPCQPARVSDNISVQPKKHPTVPKPPRIAVPLY